MKENNVDLEEKIFDEYASEDEVPWYIEVDIGWYMNRHKDEYSKGIEVASKLRQYSELCQNATRSQRGALARKYMELLCMNKRTFYRKVEAYREALAWAMRLEEQEGCSYEYYTSLAMCSEPIDTDKFPSLTDEMKAFIDNKWYDKKLAKNNLSMAMVYELFEEEAKRKKWVRLPSYFAVRRYIKKLMETESTAHYLVSNNKREWKRNIMYKARRDTKSLLVNEIWQGDCHKFDFWAKVIRVNGKVTAVKPCLVAWLDMRSRCLVGWAICEVPNQQVMKQTLVHAFYKKKDEEVPFEGVCKYLLIDNGKEFTAESLTGRPRKIRVSFDNETMGFYKSMGIEDDMRSKPYEPWNKAQVERLFGTICSTFSKWFDSYVGTLTGSKTTGKIKKDIPKMLENNKLVTIEEVAEAFEKWLKEKYHVRSHGGLKEQGEDWIKPIEVYTNAEKYEKHAPSLDYARYSMLVTDEVTVGNTGITRKKLRYYSEELGRYIKQKVIIRYNPDDVRILHVYDKNNGNKICEAVLQGNLGMVGKVNEKQLAEHMRLQNKQYKDDLETIRYRQTPYEDRFNNEEEPINLENDKKLILPELKGEPQKVVSLPNDKEYSQEVRDREKGKPKSKDKHDDRNEFFEKQAQKALDAIRKLG